MTTNKPHLVLLPGGSAALPVPEPVPVAEPRHHRAPSVAYGSKYEAGLDVAEIAKRVRKELKELAPTAKFAVRISRYSGGRSLNVTIDAVPFVIVNEARVRRDLEEPHTFHERELPLYSDEARALLKAVEAVVAAYNFDGSDSMTDYFHVNFYGDVKFDWQGQEGREKDAMRARFTAEKAARETALRAHGCDVPGDVKANVDELAHDEALLRRAHHREAREDAARYATRDACPAAWTHEPGRGCGLCE